LKLESRYLLWPSLALDRLTESPNGQLTYQLPHPRRDGATHLLLDPRELIEKLCVLIARRVRKLGPRLRGLAVVELEHAAEPLTALQRACSARLCPGRDKLVAEALVRPFLMVMVHELSNGSAEVLLAEKDDSLQALGLGGQDEPFRMGVEVGTPGWQRQWFRAALPEHAPDGGRVERVPVEDEVAHTAKEPVLRVGQFPCGLHHPGFVRLVGDSRDLHPARLEAHHEENKVSDQSTDG
jgi:hypothetical protein